MPESTKSPAEVLERVPNFSDLEVAFGARSDAFLTREQMGDEFYGDRNDFTRHVGSLFFSGGSVLPDGRRWKEGVNPKKAGRAVAAWLRSFDPKHEIKIGTVGYALSRWTEPSDALRQASRRGGEA